MTPLKMLLLATGMCFFVLPVALFFLCLTVDEARLGRPTSAIIYINVVGTLVALAIHWRRKRRRSDTLPPDTQPQITDYPPPQRNTLFTEVVCITLLNLVLLAGLLMFLVVMGMLIR